MKRKDQRLLNLPGLFLLPTKSGCVNNWASALATTYEPLTVNSLLAKIRDMTTFMNCSICSMSQNAHSLRFTGRIQNGSSQNSMSNRHCLSVEPAIYPPLWLELLVPEQMWIDDVCTYDISDKYGISHWWFNRQKFYIDRHDSSSRRKDVRTHMRILSVVKIKAYSRYGYDYMSEIILRRADFQEYTIVEKDFKNLYPSNFEDLNLLLLQGHLDHLPD
ncbi:hypothetical protein Tco_0438379 [Tanacetum coccineum]